MKRKEQRKRRAAGAAAVQEIRKHQKCTEVLLMKTPFQRLVREITQAIRPNPSSKQSALLALQTTAEYYLIGLLHDVNLAAIHAKRITLKSTEIAVARRKHGEGDDSRQWGLSLSYLFSHS